MRHILKWLFGIGLLIFSAGCLPTPQSLPQNTPTVMALATSTLAPAEQPIPASPQRSDETQAPTPQESETLSPDSTPGAGETPDPLKSREAASCPGPASQLGVSYVDSAILARRVAYSLYLPPCYETNPTRLYPVLYLLHGANADHTQWPDLQIQPDADALIARGVIGPLIVVMPGGEYRQSEDYGSFVLHDLIPHVERSLRAATDRKDRAIGGLSQGGYWALELALARPDLFSAVGGHSPATASGLTDLLASNRSPELNTMRIYLDVGDADPLAPGVAAFATALRAQGLAPVYHVYPGAHNRPYWRSHTAEYLGFYALNW